MCLRARGTPLPRLQGKALLNAGIRGGATQSVSVSLLPQVSLSFGTVRQSYSNRAQKSTYAFLTNIHVPWNRQAAPIQRIVE
jgi:hypothetical protein